jgi:menaquinone-dependent protoporphyrinogen IX oxidase
VEKKKKQVDYNVDNATSSDAESSVGDVPERLEYELANETNAKFVVNADVDYDESIISAPVAVLERADFTDEDIKAIVEKVFDAGSAAFYVPYEYRSMDELQEEKEILDEELAEYSDDEKPQSLILQYLVLSDAIEYYDDEQILDTSGGIKWYSGAGAYGMPTSAYWKDPDSSSFCYVTGTIDGRAYRLEFYKYSTGSSMTLRCTEQPISNLYYDSEGGVSDAYAIADDSKDMPESGNPCTYTMEEAEKMAEDYMSKLGYSDYAVTDAYNAEYPAEEIDESGLVTYDNLEVNGYMIFLGRRVKNLSTVYSIDQTRMELSDYHIGDEEWSYNYGYESAWVYVNDNGIEQCSIINPMKVTEVSTENASLLSFSSVDGMAQNYMDRVLKYDCAGGNAKVYIKDVKFGLGRVSSDDGESYSLIPMWFYFDDTNYYAFNYVYPEVSFAVNAIDGSIIDPVSGRTVGDDLIYQGVWVDM